MFEVTVTPMSTLDGGVSACALALKNHNTHTTTTHIVKSIVFVAFNKFKFYIITPTLYLRII